MPDPLTSLPEVSDAVHYYHELLSGPLQNATIEAFNKTISGGILTVSGRPVCSVLRPLFLTSSTYKGIKSASNTVLQGLSRAGKKLFEDKELRSLLGLTAEAEEILTIDTGYGAPDVSGRLDGFMSSEGEFQFVEYNADSPGGIAFGDVLGEAFLSLPVMTEFTRRYSVQLIPVRELTWQALLNSYKQWGGYESPSIAIVDWKSAVTSNEFVIMKEYFESKGAAVVIAGPDELELRGNVMHAAGRKVNIVYKRVVVTELIARYGTHHPLFEAVRKKIVCMANGFAVQMLFNKMLFAFLSDPSFGIIDDRLRLAISKHLPWTRIVRESITEFNGTKIDLLPFIEKNRQKFVLKPSTEYGGKGVILGWEVSDEIWKETLMLAAKSNYVVQERIPLGSEVYPSISDGKLTFESRYFDLDPYVWNGVNADGCGVRLSRAALLNVSAGGGSATPMMILT